MYITFLWPATLTVGEFTPTLPSVRASWCAWFVTPPTVFTPHSDCMRLWIFPTFNFPRGFYMWQDVKLCHFSEINNIFNPVLFCYIRKVFYTSVKSTGGCGVGVGGGVMLSLLRSFNIFIFMYKVYHIFIGKIYHQVLSQIIYITAKSIFCIQYMLMLLYYCNNWYLFHARIMVFLTVTISRVVFLAISPVTSLVFHPRANWHKQLQHLNPPTTEKKTKRKL